MLIIICEYVYITIIHTQTYLQWNLIISNSGFFQFLCIKFIFNSDHQALKLRVNSFRYVEFPYIKYFHTLKSLSGTHVYDDSLTRINDGLDKPDKAIRTFRRQSTSLEYNRFSAFNIQLIVTDNGTAFEFYINFKVQRYTNES